MKLTPTYIVALLLMCLSSLALSAQDLHFSQYINSPLLVNPANTGYAPDNDYRACAQYRKQWANLTSSYNTFSAWGDVQLLKNKIENGWLGLGLNMFSDEAGNGTLVSNKLYLSLAYHQLLSEYTALSFGVSGGYVQKRIDASKLTFDNQWNNKFFDVNLPIGEVFNANSVSYADFSAGINFAWFPTQKNLFNAGVSIQHLNAPNESFTTGAQNATVPLRINSFVQADVALDELWGLLGNAYYSTMAQTSEWLVGGLVKRKLDADNGKSLLLGVYYRSMDAFIPTVGFGLQGTQIMLSYDYNNSALSKYTNSFGALELSILFNGNYTNGEPIKCPGSKRF